MISYRLTSAAIGLVIACIILVLVRRDYLHTRYASWWLVVAGTVLALGLFPGLSDVVARQMGVGYPPILPVVVCLGMILIKVLTMDLERSRQEQEIRRLVQRLALLEATRGVAPIEPTVNDEPMKTSLAHKETSMPDSKRG